MSTLEIVLLLIVIALVLAGLFFYIWYFQKTSTVSNNDQFNNQFEQIRSMQAKLNESVIAMKTTNQNTGSTVGTLTKDIQNLNTAQGFSKDKINEILNKIRDLDNQGKEVGKVSGTVAEQVKHLNNIFINSYQRGKLGETSLAIILKDMLSDNPGIIHEQFQLLNKNRVDFLLKLPRLNLPIDSKFPYDNFVKLFEFKKDSPEYIETIKKLKTDIETKIKDIATKYISAPDNTFQAVMYIPSQSLFELIYSNKDFNDITKLSADKKVWISGPNTFTIMLHTINAFSNDWKRSKNLTKILQDLEKFKEEFNRFDDRWDKLDSSLDTVVKNVKNINTTRVKITKQFGAITNPKVIESTDQNKPIIKSGKQ